MITLNTFSVFVVGATLPKPTDVRDEKVKYRAVTYRERIDGPPEMPSSAGA
jgi:hypothetical protein